MALGKRLINTGGAAAAACSTDSVQAFGADAAFSSNIALYQLDGNDNDTTGNYNGTSDTDVTYSSTGAYIGEAANFNGSSSGITVNSFASLSQLGLSMWVKIADVTSNYALAARYGTNREFAIYNSQASNGFVASIYYNGNNGNAIIITAGDYLTNNTWHHIAFTSDGSTAPKLYIDGVERGTAQYSDAARCAYYTSTEPLEIGKGVSRFLNGTIDQVRIFDKAISAEDVATLYAETTSTASDTNPFSEGAGVALYTMDYDASEASGYYDGTPTDVDFGVEGKINYGARFNGSSSKITTSAIAGLSSVSVSIWLKSSNSTSTERRGIIEINSGTAQGIAGTLMVLYKFSNGEILVRSGNASSSETNILTHTDTSLRDGNWHNLIVTRNESTGVTTLYIDGSQVDQETVSNTSTVGQGSIIGDRYTTSSGNFNWDGSIDQVRVFSKAINQTEVDTLYAETACVYTSTTDIVNYPTGTTPIAYYKLDNSSEDYSTGGNDGTDTDVEYRFGRFGQAASFDGSGDSIQINGFSGFTNYNFTLSIWIKTTDTQGYITSFRDPMYITFILGGYSGGTTGMGIYDGTNQYFINNTAMQGINDGNWHHIVMTHDGTNLKGYINGSIIDTVSTGTTTQSSGGTNHNRIGMRGDGNSSSFDYNGLIDQVRIYDAALTDSQVTELYNEKPEVDTSNFKAVLYEGTAANQYISNVGMDLETSGGLVWIKNRSSSSNYFHALIDSVRGVGKILSSNTDSVDSTTYTDQVTSLEANGFFVGNNSSGGNYVNLSGDDYVGWVFKGGGDAVNIGVNSITGSTPSIASDVSANTAAGFSIVKYTGNNTDGATVGTGLTTPCNIVIVKDLTSANYWCVGGSTVGNGENLYLNDAGEKLTRDRVKSVQTNTFTLGNHSETNSTNNFIAYCFHSVAGYSSIGTYTGNGNATGTIVSLDFAPSFVMIKGTDQTSDWIMVDNKRDTTNPNSARLDANSSDQESSDTIMDLNSDGFQLKTSSAAKNGLDKVFIYMAFK